MISKREKHYLKTTIQIFLLISLTFTLSYFANESSKVEGEKITIAKEAKPNILFSLLARFMRMIFSDRGFVSALDLPVNTCLKSKNGSICQEYATNLCADRCDGQCIPSISANVAECKLGTCFDPVEGTCAPRATRFSCEEHGGNWTDDANGNTPECRKGCCTIGSGTDWVTERRCERMSSIGGVVKSFNTTIIDDAGCYYSAKTQEVGACVLDVDLTTGKKNCIFTTRAECTRRRGEFASGFLCSASELGTKCEKQKKSGCVDGKEELYWFDSCNNRENIYDENKIRSWNNGKVLTKEESCSLSSGGNGLANQGNCGNCDRVKSPGTTCSKKTASQKLNDISQEYVCKSLACVDTDGNARSNGDSWCIYQGSIGEKDNRVTATPGSRHFRASCFDGNISIDACQDRRMDICTEDKESHTAACRMNLGYLCLSYNTESDKENMREMCTENPDCFIKKISVPDSSFNFDFCSPKYPTGFSQTTNRQLSEKTCNFASLSCTAVRVKSLGGPKWYNQGCLRPEFTQQMNDFCMSLGDCGAKVNYIGDSGSEGFKVKGWGRQLTEVYLNILREYSQKTRDYVQPADIRKYLEATGYEGEGGPYPEGLGQVNFPEDFSRQHGGEFVQGGMAGLTVLVGAGKIAAAVGPFLGAAAAAIAGAAVGAAVVVLLVKLLGIGAGLPDWFLYSAVAAGATAGIMIALATYGSIAPAFGWVGLIVLVVIIIILIVLTLIGIGKKSEYPVSVQCHAWEPPIGGTKCGECGNNGLICSQYACESLGTECELVNEGTSKQKCVRVPSDAAPPQIRALQGVLTDGFSYVGESERGFELKSSTADGCIPAFTRVNFGIALNEYGKCTMKTQSIKGEDLLNAYDITQQEVDELGLDLNEVADDEVYFGGDPSYALNHTHILEVPSLESLGFSGIDPDKRIDFNMHITCSDKGGHKNPIDYVIKTCISPERDISHPVILRKEPISGFVKADAAVENISIFTSEPANCSYDFIDKDYRAMSNKLYCDNGLNNEKQYGWQCSGFVPLTINETNIFIRCIDKPWLEGINESDRNAMDDSEPFTLTRTSPLRITSIKPDNETIYSGNDPTTVKVEVRTAGGADNGNAKCGYLLTGNRYAAFGTGYGTSVQGDVWDQATGGDYVMQVQCADFIGNYDTKVARFKIEIDKTPPVITKYYNRGGTLVVKTNENAECAFSFEKCEFEFNNGTMMIGTGTEHTTSFSSIATRYITCRDRFKNAPGSCTLTIRGG